MIKKYKLNPNGFTKKILILFVIFFAIYFVIIAIIGHRAGKLYSEAITQEEKGNYQGAINIYRKISYYEDSSKRIALLESKIEKEALLAEEKQREEEEENKIIEDSYNDAVRLYTDRKYNEAAQKFALILDYKDSLEYYNKSVIKANDQVKAELYASALTDYNSGNYYKAADSFRFLENYSNSQFMTSQCYVKIRRLIASTISAGVDSTLAIGADGSVMTTMKTSIADVFSQWDDIVSVQGHGVIYAGLKSDGTVVTASTVDGFSVDTSGWKDIIQIAVGQQHIIGLTKDGKVLADGGKGDHRIDIGNDWSELVSVTCGWRHSAGIDEDGTLYIVGYRSQTQLDEYKKEKDEWKGVYQLAAGGGRDEMNGEKESDVKGKGHTVGLKKDGTVVAVGDNSLGQCDVDDWTDIVAIAAGDWHTVGLKSDGTVVATGSDGSAGYGSYKNATAVEDWTDIVAISAGTGYTVGLKRDGSVVAVGYNAGSQITSVENLGKKVMVYSEWPNVSD